MSHCRKVFYAVYNIIFMILSIIYMLNHSLFLCYRDIDTRVIFYVRREVDFLKTAKVNAFIMHIFGKIELLSIHAT